MRFNNDLLPGALLSFEEIAQRYAEKYPDEKELTARGLLSPSTSNRSMVIRAIFANEESNSPLDELLFVANDNERKNYLRRLEHYLQQQLPFLYLRRGEAERRDNLWRIMGESRVYAMLDPASAAAQNLFTSRGYTLSIMRYEGEEAYWQLYDAQAHACFPQSRRIQFIVVLQSPLLKVPAAVMPGTQVGRRVKARLWQRASQTAFAEAVRARYGACVITGTPLTANPLTPWVEACHIDMRENEEGFLADNNVDNGLFLRSDLQRLFNNKLLSIHADSGEVFIASTDATENKLSEFYQQISGKPCQLWHLVPATTRERLRRLR